MFSNSVYPWHVQVVIGQLAPLLHISLHPPTRFALVTSKSPFSVPYSAHPCVLLWPKEWRRGVDLLMGCEPFRAHTWLRSLLSAAAVNTICPGKLTVQGQGQGQHAIETPSDPQNLRDRQSCPSHLAEPTQDSQMPASQETHDNGQFLSKLLCLA